MTSSYNQRKGGKWLRNFQTSPVLGPKPLKKNRKSSFNQLAGAKKHECKILSEYLIFLYERNELNEITYA